MNTYFAVDGPPGDFPTPGRTGLRNDDRRDSARQFAAGRRSLLTSPTDAVRPRLSPPRSEPAEQTAHPHRIPVRELTHVS
ncbi:hypothetical protein [Streptomyces sp. NPDC048419]|uniref:hypothetical protein n=1 Tax=Streptomyces sp. NPDC048419 TaxID=3365547 RepID=UPI003718CF4A